ncbi:MAG: NADPH-dependent FMN reductase [Bryobacteraceae bacterium]
MNSKPLRLAVVIGSTREGRFGPTVARWFAEIAARGGRMEVDVIDLAESRLPDTLTEQRPAEVAALAPRLAAADAFVIVTPEYNHSFPAPLKSAIDWYSGEWQAKPVGFVSYGGVSGGLRAVEQLRQIFAELHAVTVQNTVMFQNAWTQFDGEGRLREPDRSERSAETMLRQIAWWGEALREARKARPFAA